MDSSTNKHAFLESGNNEYKKKKNSKLWFAIVKKRSYRPVRTQFEKIKEYTDKNMLFLANIAEAHMQRDIYVYEE